jgi:hypothetical protein
VAIGGKTQREMEYITAIADYYHSSEQLDSRTRALNYQKAMEHLYSAYPDDLRPPRCFASSVAAATMWPPALSPAMARRLPSTLISLPFSETHWVEA